MGKRAEVSLLRAHQLGLPTRCIKRYLHNKDSALYDARRVKRQKRRMKKWRV